LLSLVKRWKEFVAGISDAKIMFDLYSDTESAKTIKALREVVDSLSARLRTGGLRSQHAASDVQALKKQISILESKVNGLHDDIAARGAKSVAHTELLPQEGRTVEKRRLGTRGGGGEGGGEQGGGERASVNTEVPVQDQTRTRRIRYKPASKDIK
jgi:hypothetical protein